MQALSVGGVVACTAVFVALRIDVVRHGGESRVDRWVARYLDGGGHESPLTAFVERLVAAPGSLKGSILIILAIGAWAWVRYRDVRWGALLAATFTATAGTVEIIKIGLVLEPFGANLDRAYLSLHAANTTAVFGMLLLMSVLTHDRALVIVSIGAVAGGVIALVAFSVMLAGHHWLTDVIGGLAVAGAWVFSFAPAAYSMWQRPELVATLRTAGGGIARPGLVLPPFVTARSEAARR